MDYQTIRAARLREPFVPFWLRTKSGRVYHIDRPEWLVVSSRSVGVIDREDGSGVYLTPNEVEHLEYLAMSTPDGNE